MTDEDKMMQRLIIHRDMIGWIIKKLQEEGIKAERTTGNDSKGDILLINPEDEPRVQEMIRNIQQEYNP